MGNNVKILGHSGENCFHAVVPRARIVTDPPTGRPSWRFRLRPCQKRSEGETNTDCRSNVGWVDIGHAGAMRNGDGQTTAHEGIGNSDVTVETFSEVIIRIDRRLIKGARAGTAETG